MLQSLSPQPPSNNKSIRLKTARLFQLTPSLSEDEVDRLPSAIRVNCYDIICYLFSMFTYVFDMVLDVLVGIEHFQNGRILAFILTILFVGIPSLLINIISLFWWLDDRIRESNQTDSTDEWLIKERLQRITKISAQKVPIKMNIEMTDADLRVEPKRSDKLKWILATIFQVAPLIWHFRALKAAYTCMQIQKLPRRERLLYYRFYFKMIEADRDASVLRFFEALLESLPQLLIQGYFLLDNLVKSLDNNAIEFDWKLRAFAMIASLLSISFSFVSHHRSLRICLPDKQNLNVTGCNLILIWRFLSIFGRFVFLSLLIYSHSKAALILLGLHLLLSIMHISINQRIETNTKFDFLDKLMIGINAWIHFFAPFNMTSGRTQKRYLVAYSIEIIEIAVIFVIINYFSSLSMMRLVSYTGILIWSPILYIIGLLVMMGYFLFAHQ